MYFRPWVLFSIGFKNKRVWELKKKLGLLKKSRLEYVLQKSISNP